MPRLGMVKTTLRSQTDGLSPIRDRSVQSGLSLLCRVRQQCPLTRVLKISNGGSRRPGTLDASIWGCKAANPYCIHNFLR